MDRETKHRIEEIERRLGLVEQGHFPPRIRCPVVIESHGHFEQCCLERGHDGNHRWGNGD